MFRRFSVNFALFSILFDGGCIALSLFLASELRLVINPLPFINPIPEVTIPPDMYLLFPAVWVFVMLLQSVYDGRKNLRVTDEYSSLALGSVIASVCLAGVLYLSYREISRALFGLFVLLAFTLLVTWRGTIRLVYWRIQPENHLYHRVLIAGRGEWGRRLESEIRTKPYFGLALVGYLAENQYDDALGGEVIGRLEDIREVVIQRQIDDVVIALPRSAFTRLNQLVTVLHDLPVKVWVIPDYYSLALHRAQMEEFAGIPMLDLRAPALTDYQRMIKRAFDLIVAVALSIPVLILTALTTFAIRLDSPGPVFFRQKRVGENGRLFEMVKFRTMVQNADQLRHLVEVHDENGKVLQNKCPHDPRVTRVGGFLRKTSLDELPQLFNVLRGDMSLVGPRPELPYLVDKYDAWQRKRFAVPQGMTGWWQVNGRSDKPMHLHTDEDLYYVQHYSIWLDMQIIVKTVWIVLRGKGAY
jgi:exopolysaccharide biosynthesis polyprenyl glycosylphosphotransferase